MFVKWNKERFVRCIRIPSYLTLSQRFTFNVSLDARLGDLRQLITEETHLDAFKLIYKGAVLKDDKQPLSSYHLRHTSTITLLPLNTAPPPPSAVQKTEQSSISIIQQELSAIHQSLVPSLTVFLESLSTEGASSSSMQKEHARLGELLLQSLLRLDAISSDGDWEDARRERKAAVKEVQALLDKLDDAWSSSNSVTT